MLIRFMDFTFFSICLLPWTWLGLFFAYVSRAFFLLGRWPAPYRPDPKDLGFDWHHATIYIVFLMVGSSIVVWPLFSVYFRNRSKESQLFSKFYWVGVATLLVIVILDPGRFLEWFLD